MKKRIVHICILVLVTSFPKSVQAASDLNWRSNSFYKTDEDRHSMQPKTETKSTTVPKRALSDIFKGIELTLKTSGTIDNISGTQKTEFGDKSTGASAIPNRNDDIVAIARKYIGVPYVWGGKTPDTGFDCSGFVSYVYKEYGIDIPSYTISLMSVGDNIPVDRLKNGIFSDLVPGDLMVSPDHVTMYTGNGKMIHAPDVGQGIKEVDIGSWWIPEVTCIRRLIN